MEIRLVVVDVDTLRALLHEALATLSRVQIAPAQDFYSQEHLPPGMSRSMFLNAIRRGDFPARRVGKLRFVQRADFETFLKKQPSTGPDLVKVRDILRTARGGKS